jgi:hypothetical protein
MAGMHQKPVYDGRIYSDHGNREVTFGDFLRAVFISIGYVAEPRSLCDPAFSPV